MASRNEVAVWGFLVPEAWFVLWSAVDVILGPRSQGRDQQLVPVQSQLEPEFDAVSCVKDESLWLSIPHTRRT